MMTWAGCARDGASDAMRCHRIFLFDVCVCARARACVCACACACACACVFWCVAEYHLIIDDIRTKLHKSSEAAAKNEVSSLVPNPQHPLRALASPSIAVSFFGGIFLTPSFSRLFVLASPTTCSTPSHNGTDTAAYHTVGKMLLKQAERQVEREKEKAALDATVQVQDLQKRLLQAETQLRAVTVCRLHLRVVLYGEVANYHQTASLWFIHLMWAMRARSLFGVVLQVLHQTHANATAAFTCCRLQGERNTLIANLQYYRKVQTIESGGMPSPMVPQSGPVSASYLQHHIRSDHTHHNHGHGRPNDGASVGTSTPGANSIYNSNLHALHTSSRTTASTHVGMSTAAAKSGHKHTSRGHHVDPVDPASGNNLSAITPSKLAECSF